MTARTGKSRNSSLESDVPHFGCKSAPRHEPCESGFSCLSPLWTWHFSCRGLLHRAPQQGSPEWRHLATRTRQQASLSKHPARPDLKCGSRHRDLETIERWVREKKPTSSKHAAKPTPRSASCQCPSSTPVSRFRSNRRIEQPYGIRCERNRKGFWHQTDFSSRLKSVTDWQACKRL